MLWRVKKEGTVVERNQEAMSATVLLVLVADNQKIMWTSFVK